MGCTPLKSTVWILLRLVHKIMRAIGQVLWLFNCWTFRVSFVVYTDSFVGSTWASDSDLGRSWKRVVICIGLWGLEDLCLDVCSVFCGCFSSTYQVLLHEEMVEITLFQHTPCRYLPASLIDRHPIWPPQPCIAPTHGHLCEYL